MDELDCACGREREIHCVMGRRRAGGCFSGGQRQDRAETFAAGHQAVAHRFEDGGGAGWGGWQISRQSLFHLRATGGEVLVHPSSFEFAVPAVLAEKAAPAGLSSPRSLRISMRFSASSRRAWQNRESCTPRS